MKLSEILRGLPTIREDVSITSVPSRAPARIMAVAAEFLDAKADELMPIRPSEVDKVLTLGRELSTKMIPTAAGKYFVRLFRWQQKYFAKIEAPDDSMMFSKAEKKTPPEE